jgi:hypothetical protein
MQQLATLTMLPRPTYLPARIDDVHMICSNTYQVMMTPLLTRDMETAANAQARDALAPRAGGGSRRRRAHAAADEEPRVGQLRMCAQSSLLHLCMCAARVVDTWLSSRDVARRRWIASVVHNRQHVSQHVLIWTCVRAGHSQHQLCLGLLRQGQD